MSIDNGWNAIDKAAEEDYDNSIARSDAIEKLAEQYEKDLLAGKPIMVDGVQWETGEMVAECGVDPADLFKAIMCQDYIEIACIEEKVREFIMKLAEEHIDNMEPDYD